MPSQPVFYAFNNAEAFTDLPAEKLRNDSIDSLHASKLSAYARLDFKASSFYLQTLHAVIGRTDPVKDIRVDIDLVCESAAVAEAANNDNDTAPFDETTKPPFLIHQLILNAIRASPPGCTGLSYHQITLMIQKLYPYYGSTACKEDWKPAVKFNLVHNKMFTKITSPATANGSKKRKWVIDEHYLFERQRQLNEEQGEVPTTTPSAENETYNQLSRYELPVPAATSPIHSKSSRRNSSNNSSIRARRDSLSQDPGYIKFIKMLKAAYFKALAKHNPADISPDAGPFIKLVLRTLRARHMDLERLLLKAYTLEDPQAQRQLLSVVKMVLRRTLDGNSASTSPARKASGVNQGPKLVHV